MRCICMFRILATVALITRVLIILAADWFPDPSGKQKKIMDDGTVGQK